MSDIAIRVENLSKRYRIGQRERYKALRDVITDAFAAPFRRLRRTEDGGRKTEAPSPVPHPRSSVPSPRSPVPGPRSDEWIWALKDVSFEVKQGEVVGIIGRNGAGKSTLLKVLSRITEPTQGRAEIHGRVGSLLEVGTGFHPELTGQENIYLNGAILGMRKAEIERRFDEIVAFAEVEKFIDTPVKHYSSGMYVRLAFAVAAHLEPEILLVDEVLAVGDASFQKKCLGKMGQVGGQGRTVLFVSHNMAAVSALCPKAIVLRDGVVQFGPASADNAIQEYLGQLAAVSMTSLADRKDRQGEGRIRITGFCFYDRKGSPQTFVLSGQQVEFQIHYECTTDTPPRHVVAAIGITSYAGSFATLLSNQMASEPFAQLGHRGTISCVIKKFPLAPGLYTCNLIIRRGEVIEDWIQEAAILTVEPGDFYGTGRIPPQSHGGVFVEQAWLLHEGPLANVGVWTEC